MVPETPENSAAQTEILALAAQYGVAVEVAAEQTILPFGNAELTVFPPLGTSGSNELGLSVLASAGEGDFLITGDMDRARRKSSLNVMICRTSRFWRRDTTAPRIPPRQSCCVP